MEADEPGPGGQVAAVDHGGPTELVVAEADSPLLHVQHVPALGVAVGEQDAVAAVVGELHVHGERAVLDEPRRPEPLQHRRARQQPDRPRETLIGGAAPAGPGPESCLEREDRVAPGRLLPCGREFPGDAGELARDVVQFGRVGEGVEQLPLRLVERRAGPVERDELPAVLEVAAVAAELGVLLGVRTRQFLLAQHFGEAGPVAILRLAPVPARGRLEPGEFEEGREDVGDVPVLVPDAVVAVGRRRPAGQETMNGTRTPPANVCPL